jgi:3-hydroxymyristoyl/3-hydroxydecanoyl-(acyl carrier protein) dehydratase
MQEISASMATVRSEPQVLAVKRDGDAVRVMLHVPEDLCYFEGHFPGCALLPGVVQMNWAIAFGRKHFPEYFAARSRFVHLSNIKFMRVIVPGKTVALRLRELVERGELAFEYSIGDSLCSSGQIGFPA